MRKHKTLGQVYTPVWVVKEILDLIGYNNISILTSSIMEPACGDGAFLTEIVKRYIATAQENNWCDNKIKNGLETFIYGIELDLDEYQKCIENLNKTIKTLTSVKSINWNILNNNTLYTYDKYLSHFDFIAGNPPYVRIHNLDDDIRDFIKDNFTYSEGTIDIYISFFEMAFKMIKPDGLIGYITPNSFLHNASYNKFRDFLQQSKSIKTLIDFKSNKIFDGYSTYTAITILNFKNTKESFKYKELVDGKIKTLNNISFSELNNKKWSFTNRENEAFLINLQKGTNSTISDYFNVQYGFATLRDKIFTGQTIDNKENSNLPLFNGEPMEPEILKPVVKGSKFNGLADDTRKIIFPYKKENDRYIVIPEQEMKSVYPHCYAYFLKNKEELLARKSDRGALWYQYGRSQGVQTMHQEKIVLSTMMDSEIKFHKISADVMVYSGIFITRKSTDVPWAIIENLLLSKDFVKFVRLTGKDLSGGYKSVTTKQIKDFRINYSPDI